MIRIYHEVPLLMGLGIKMNKMIRVKTIVLDSAFDAI